MKCFARFQTAEEHEELVQGIIREKQLRQLIEEYRDLRNKGFLTKEEVDAEMQRRKQAKNKKKSTNEYGYALGNYDQSRVFLVITQNRRQKQEQEANSLNRKNLNLYINPDEVELCRSHKLSPVAYMMIKETILREYSKLGSLERDHIFGIFCVEKHVINSIINSMISRREIVCRG